MNPLLTTVTKTDLERLNSIIESAAGHSSAIETLEEKLSRAEIIDAADAPADLVTMNSEIRCVTDDDQALYDRIRLVYPQQANIESGCVSIFTPLGIALLGRRIGMNVTWNGHDHQERSVYLQTILYQPEAQGDWYL